MEQLSFELLFIFFFPCVSFSLYVFRQRVTFHLIAETTHQTINSQNILQCMIFLGYLQLHEMDLGTSAFTAYMSTSFDTIINHVNVTNLFYFSIGFKIKSWKPLSTYLLYVRFFSFFFCLHFGLIDKRHQFYEESDADSTFQHYQMALIILESIFFSLKSFVSGISYMFF